MKINRWALLSGLGSFGMGFSFTSLGLLVIGGFLGWFLGFLAAASVFLFVVGWVK